MKKIFTVFGTRPEAIKMFPAIAELKKRGNYSCVVCVTAQHRHMLDQVLNIFNIIPDYDLNIMKDDQDLFDITQGCLIGLKDILKREMPDLVLVQGDTTTAFVAGLAAYYFKISVAHIEAGLRTNKKFSPFPEEKNRQILSVLGDYHFAPTLWSRDNLIREGINSDTVFVTGNTVVDALKFTLDKQRNAGEDVLIKHKLQKKYGIDFDKKTLLVTGHRRENFGDNFKEICLALKEIAFKQKMLQIVYPVHLNPNVQKPVYEILSNIENVILIPPLDYWDFVLLMSKSYLILTDSGGVQEEAPFLGIPVLVMRDSTERPEGILSGVSKIVGHYHGDIVKSVMELCCNEESYRAMSKAESPYGDGTAALKIADCLDMKL